MAKQKTTNNEGGVTPVPNEIQSAAENRDAVITEAGAPSKEGALPVVEEQEQQQKEAKSSASNERAPFIDDILRNYPGYESLYIDFHGGCFTPDTPSALRGKAVLYANPHHKS